MDHIERYGQFSWSVLMAYLCMYKSGAIYIFIYIVHIYIIGVQSYFKCSADVFPRLPRAGSGFRMSDAGLMSN